MQMGDIMGRLDGKVALISGGARGQGATETRLFTKSTAVQHAHENIRCNSVHPGPIETPMIQDSLNDPAQLEERLQRIPLGRIGSVDDVAYGVLYLASDESRFVTGSELVIDGGVTAQ
jgi:NAD(P)-dependent dehydrogenase (short-subunit alcohol dehydrogenase family)